MIKECLRRAGCCTVAAKRRDDIAIAVSRIALVGQPAQLRPLLTTPTPGVALAKFVIESQKITERLVELGL